MFMLLSPIVAFVGVLACYQLRVVWATILFLVVPLSWRCVMILVLSYNMLTSTGSVLLPDIQHPVSASSEQFSFDHPKDWKVIESGPLDQHSVAQVEIESQTAEALMLIRVLRLDGIDPNEHDLALMTQAGYQVVNKTVRPDAQLGVLHCYSEEYELRMDQQQYKMLHLVASLDSNNGVLIRILTTPRYWDASLQAAMQIINSLSIKSNGEKPADLASPTNISRDWFTCESPGNWIDGGETHPQFEAVERRAFGWTDIRFTMYDRSKGGGGYGSPEKELDALLEYGMHKDRMISHSPMNNWMGFNGVGAKGKIWQPLTGVHDFWAIFVPLNDGRVLGIKKYQAESSAGLTDPGFELIESTFKLLVEPAKVDP